MHALSILAAILLLSPFAGQSVAIAQSAQDPEVALPIADAHVHYSHDSVELTPPQRVIDIMREAGLKFALVSSSDDNGTQLLSEIAPDLIVPGLRPYRRRGELSTWFKDPAALEYVEALLEKNQYASLGEFHLYGADVDLPIPRRIAELAEEHNLILHAHSDADAVSRLLAQNEKVKVLWAHSGFESPDEIASMLAKHDRLWADLAFRSEVGSGGSLSDDWQKLFEAHPDRIMLGTDTYTPERMYYIPEHANSARTWLSTLPTELATNLAWKNAHDLLMPVWKLNSMARPQLELEAQTQCEKSAHSEQALIQGEKFVVLLTPLTDINVSEPFSVNITVCSDIPVMDLKIDASMPAHGHGMNYTPEVTALGTALDTEVSENKQVVNEYRADGMVFHMPGQWQWSVDLQSGTHSETLIQAVDVQ